MVNRECVDVVIVGGGPAGSATAIHLARTGIDVVLLDRAEFPREKACAEYCSPGVVDALDNLGALERIRAREHRDLGSMQVVAHGQAIPLTFSSDRPNGNRALGIKRSVLDEELLGLAADSGVRVYQRTRVTTPLIQADGVTGVEYRSGDRLRTIHAAFVVGADGLHSTVARKLGLERPVRWPRRLGLVARFSGLPAPVDSGQMHIADGIYCGLSPVTTTEANVSLVVPMGAKPAGTTAGEFFDTTIGQLPGIADLLGDAERITGVRGFGPLGKRVRRTSGKGYLLVGDAAGFFDPLTGEGVHRALNGGRLAAESITTALETGSRSPVGYGRSRSREFTDKQRVCHVIQLLLAVPGSLDYVTRRASSRPAVASQLCGILGDYAPARQAIHPSFLWNLLRP